MYTQSATRGSRRRQPPACSTSRTTSPRRWTRPSTSRTKCCPRASTYATPPHHPASRHARGPLVGGLSAGFSSAAWGAAHWGGSLQAAIEVVCHIPGIAAPTPTHSLGERRGSEGHGVLDGDGAASQRVPGGGTPGGTVQAVRGCSCRALRSRLARARVPPVDLVASTHGSDEGLGW